MREDHLEQLEKLFPQGCVILYSKEIKQGIYERYGIVALNPKKKSVLAMMHILISDTLRRIKLMANDKRELDEEA